MIRGLKALRLLIAIVLAGTLVGCLSADELDHWRKAALYAYGPYQYAMNVERLRQRNASFAVGLNQIAHNPKLADHTSREVTAPNADTIYSSAVLDLSASPVELTLPAASERYVSVMLMDIFTDVVATIGSQPEETPLRRYWIVGPDWAGELPEETGLIQMPGPDAWLLARTFVAGPDDLPTARQIQQQITLRPIDVNAQPAFPVSPAETPSAEDMLRTVNILLGRAPDHPHTQRGATFADLGLRPGDADAWNALSGRKQRVWKVAFERLEAGLNAALSEQGLTLGWQRAPRNLGQFGEDDATRAAVSLIGFGALQAEEATYFTADSTKDGEVLNGQTAYTLTLDPDTIPVNAFWSLSLYAIETDKRRFFVDNPDGYHVINSATPDLIRGEDGTLTIQMSAQPPQDSTNWMPAPEGSLALIFRAYLPGEAILSGDWIPPEIEPLSSDD